MKVAVIIPTLNEEEHIGFLESLVSNTYKDKEIVFVDGGSKDRTVGIAKMHGVTVLKESGEKNQKCPANARNQGAKYANAEILCFMDADCEEVDRNFIANAVKAFDKDTVAAYGKYRTKMDTLVERIVSKETGSLMEPTFIRKDAFLETGGFPLIGFGEDRILGEKIKEYAKTHKKTIKTIEEPFWTGHGVHTIRALYKQKVWYGRTSILYLMSLDKKRLSNAIRIFYQPIYFLSFLSVLLTPVFGYLIFFSIPFFVIFLVTIARNFGGWNMGKVFMNIFSGYAMLYGVLFSLFIKNAKIGR